MRLETSVGGNLEINYEIRILIGSKSGCLRTLVARTREETQGMRNM